MISIPTMSQHRYNNLQKSYLELLRSYGDESYMVEKLMKSSTTSVYPTFPDSDDKLAENRN